MRKHPEQLQGKKQSSNRTTFCWAYPSDLEQFYAFYCARYENISYNDFLHLGLTEALMKLNSIPESEPLYKIIKSRTISLAKIKDKSERKYWAELKKINNGLRIAYDKYKTDANYSNELLLKYQNYFPYIDKFKKSIIFKIIKKFRRK